MSFAPPLVNVNVPGVPTAPLGVVELRYGPETTVTPGATEGGDVSI